MTPADLAALERCIPLVGAAAGGVIVAGLVTERALLRVGAHEPARLAALADLTRLHAQAEAAGRPEIADFLARCIVGLVAPSEAGPGRPAADHPATDAPPTAGRAGRRVAAEHRRSDDDELGRTLGGRGTRENCRPSSRTRAPVRTPTRRKHRP
jgi:hypothetical protein